MAFRRADECCPALAISEQRADNLAPQRWPHISKFIENHAIDSDHDGYIDITRTAANAAKTYATVANVLVTTGAIAMAAGLTWFFIVPLITGPKAAPSGGGHGRRVLLRRPVLHRYR